MILTRIRGNLFKYIIATFLLLLPIFTSSGMHASIEGNINVDPPTVNILNGGQTIITEVAEVVPVPEVDDIKAGEDKVTGTAFETGFVEITLPDGNKVNTEVTTGNTFTVNITPLKVGEQISVVSIDSIGRESSIVNKIALMNLLDQPALNVLHDNEKVINGISGHTGTITITLSDGQKIIQEVVEDQAFSINIAKILTTGERFTVEGKDAYLNEFLLMELTIERSQKNFNGLYTIKSQKSGLLMDIADMGKEKGTNIIQWSSNGGLNQKWNFEQLENGYYKITSLLNPTLSLDVYGGGTAEGTKVIQWPYHGGINQQWKVIENLDGSVTLMSRLSVENKTYYALDVFGGGTTPGVSIIQWTYHDGDNQKWILDATQRFAEPSKDYTGTYAIRSKKSGLFMDVYGGGKTQGVNVIQWPPHGGSNQQWKFERLENGYYKITSVLSGLSIDVYGGGAEEGNKVIQWPYHGGSNQQWRIIENSDGSISLMSKLSEETYNYFLLDVFGGGSLAGVNVIQWSELYGDNQKWILDETFKQGIASVKILDVPIIAQRPELPTGCEITATTMLFNYAGAYVNKVTLAYEMPKHPSNPNLGFVGNPFLKSGWTINPPALLNLYRKYLGSGVDLTGSNINTIEYFLSNNKPVVVWVSSFYGFSVHAITLTGYDSNYIFYNDPWSGVKNAMIPRSIFISRWSGQSFRAISY